jgi:hypothetical protein
LRSGGIILPSVHDDWITRRREATTRLIRADSESRAYVVISMV